MKYKIIKRRACAWLLAIAMVLTGVNLPVNTKSVAAASTTSYSYEPITINKKDLNGSTVWGKGDSSFTMDKDGGFFSSDKQADGAFPDNGKIVTSDQVPYQLEWTGSYKYSGYDSIRLPGKKSGTQVTSDKVTMTLSSYGAYEKIYVLGTAGGFKDNTQALNFSVTLTYTDNSTSTTTYQLYDWYKNTSEIASSIDGYAIYKRLNSNGSSIDKDFGTNGGPMVQSKKIDCDKTKLLKSVSFQIANTAASVANDNGIYSAIYAVTGAVSKNAPSTPQAKEATGINTSQFTANWEKVDKAIGYKLDVSKYKNFCDENGNPSFVSEYNNLSVDGSDMTSYLIKGLDKNATYYYRVRAVGDGGQSMSSNVITVKTLDELKEVTLLNDSYPYGKNMSTSSVTLAVDVNETDIVGSYQWQYAPEKGAEEDQWENIANKKSSSAHSDEIQLSGSNLKDGYWYRCVVNGLTTSNPVQLVKANGSTMTNVTRAYTYGQWYVSNTYVAYTSLNGRFDVLGKYEKNGTYYWLQTSYSGGWQMYSSSEEKPSASSYYSGTSSLDKLRVAFDSNDKFNMKFEALLANGQKSFAFGCDTMLGNWITSGSYSDYASLKSIKEDDKVKQIQMVGAYSVDTAKATDTSFVLKYVDGYEPSYYWLGRYYSRQVWTKGTLEDVINTDSGMTSSWCKVSGGNVKFEFHVGSVADAGAKITICAASGKDSITIKDPDSTCKYALYKVVNGKEEEVSGWQELSGSSYTYDNLEPNTKYLLKAEKNGETVTSEIYTKIDTQKGAAESVNDGRIKSESTSSSITFGNLKNEYQYALTDSRGNVVKTYTSPKENEITFSGLKAGTTYYLIAKSGENDQSEKVAVTTKKAVISFDSNTNDTVTGMPGNTTKSYGTSAALPSGKPTRTGYKFAGWTTKAYKDQKVVLYRAGSYYYGETDVTLYAVWYDGSDTINESATYAVTYSGGDQTNVSNIPGAGTKKWGEPLVLSTVIPSREGYTFREWNTKADGTGDSYQPGDPYLYNENVTLYAVWNVKQYQITVEANERYTATVAGDAVTQDGHVDYGKDAEITISANDGFDISQIKAQVNGEDVIGNLSGDQRSYTITLSDIKEDKNITVSGVNVNSIAVDKSSHDFGKLMEYYAKVPTAAVITVTNDGEKITDGEMEVPVTLCQPVSAAESSVFEISKVENANLNSGDKTTFTVQPKEGLAPGVYTEDITIATTTGAKQTVKVTFEVLKDTIAPTGEITFAEKKWTSLLKEITFGLFFNKTLEAEISGQDEENGSGLDKIYYYIADQAMTQNDLDCLEDSEWTEGNTCSIAPNQKAVLYAKLTDRGGNVTYLSSDGVVLDDVAPEITGVTDGEELYIEKSYPVNVVDANLDKVYVVTEDQKEYTSADEVEMENGVFALTSKTEQSLTIYAVDKAGNRAKPVTVNFVSLTALKDAAKKTIEKQAEKEKEQIDAMGDLTKEEKEQFKKEIEEKTKAQIDAIEKAEDRTDVTKEEEKGRDDLQEEQDKAVQKDLDNAKDTAVKEIAKKAEDAKKAIDALTDLTEEEKTEAKTKIDQKAQEAKAAVEQVTDPADKENVAASKDTADQEIQKNQKNAEEIDLSHAKDTAVSDLEQKAREAKTAIDALTDLTEQEKEEAKKEIDRQTEEAKKTIEKVTDPSEKNTVVDSRETADQEIQKQQDTAEKTDLGYAKDKASEEIDKNAEAAKKAIDALEDLTLEEKKAAKEEVEKKAEAAKKEIAKITDPADKRDVSENKDNVNVEITKEQKKAVDQDLSNAKDTAVDKIDQKAEEAKKAIDSMSDLTEEEKAAAKAEISKKAEESKIEIAKVTDPASKSAVSENKDSVEQEIQKEQNKAADQDLSNAKDTAVREIDQKTEEAKNLIDSLTDLSEEEKEEAKKAIDQKAEEAKAEIAKVTDPAEKKDVSENKDSADQQIEKKKEETAQKDLGYVKDKAISEIDQKAEEAKKAIDAMTDLTEEEKEKAKAEIDQKAEKTKKEIAKVTDPEDKSTVSVSKDSVKEAIRKDQDKAADQDLSNAKETAANEITKKAEKAKETIDAMTDLTEEEKEKAKAEIDQKAEKTKEEITKVTDPASKSALSVNKDSADQEIREEQKKAENQDLNNAKEAAANEITKKAEEAKEAIDAMTDLTEEEKKTAKAEIDQKAEEAKAEIAKVTDPASKGAVSVNKDSVNEEIQKDQEKAAGKDLDNAKAAIEKKIDKETENALSAVDKLTNLSEKEKENAKEDIRKQAEKAKNNIQNTSDKSEVKNTGNVISEDILKSVDTVKKNDYEKTKDETVKGTLTVIPDSDQSAGTEKKYSISLRVGNTEVEQKDSVKTGERASFDKVPDGIYNLVVSDGENQRTTYVKVKNGAAAEIGKITLSSKNTSVDVKLGAPDIAVSGLEEIFDTDVFQTNRDAVKVIEEGSGKVDMKLTADNAEDKDGALTAEIPNGKTVDRFAELLADMIVTDANGKSENYNLNDIQTPVLIAMPLSEQEKNRTGYVLYRKHDDGNGEKIETLPMLEGDITEKPDHEGFYVDQDYVYIWAQKFSVYALAYDQGSAAPTLAPSETPAVPSETPVLPSETPAVPSETPVLPSETPAVPGETPTAPAPESTPDGSVAVTKDNKVKDQSKLSGNEIDKLKLPLLLAQGKGGNQKITLNWTKLSKTAGYECYWSYCDGKKLFRKFASTKNGKAQAVHKKLKNNRKYKYFVVAYKMVDGNKIYIAKSPQLHIAMKADKQTNVLKLDVNAVKVTLNKGKTFRLECRSTLENAKKKQVLHAKEYRYYTSNSKVASVDANGTIKAVSDGTCKITVIANNGVYREIKVTVSKTAKVTKEKKLVAEGTRFTDKATKAVYEITSLTGKTVALAGISDKNMKELEAAKTVKYDGTTYRVTSIAEKAFLGNKTLQSVILHDGIQSVGKSAFQNCKNLEKLTIYSTKWKEGSIGANALKGISSKVHVYCMESVWEKYEALVEKANIPKSKMINLIEK